LANNYIIKPIKDPNSVIDEHVTELLNTALPLNRNHDLGYHPPNSNHNNNNLSSPISSSGNNNNNSPSKYSINSPLSNMSSMMGDNDGNEAGLSLEERLRRERQRLHSNGVTQFAWTICEDGASSGIDKSRKNDIVMEEDNDDDDDASRMTGVTSTSNPTYSNNNNGNGNGNGNDNNIVKILVPLRGNIYIQDGVGPNATSPLRLLYDKSVLQDEISQKRHYRMKNQNKKSKDLQSNPTNYNHHSNHSNNQSNKDGRTHHKKTKKNNNRNRNMGSVVGRDAGAIDAQLSPDGSMVAFVVAGEIYVMSCSDHIDHPHQLNDNDDNPNIISASSDVNADFQDAMSFVEDVRNDVDTGSSRSRELNVQTNHNNYSSSSSSNNNAAETTTVIGVAPLSGMDVDFDLEEKESDVFMPRKPTRVTFGAMIDSEHDTYDNMYHYNDDSDDNSDDDSDDDDNNNNYEKSPDSKINRTKKKRHGRSVTHGLADFVAQEEMDRYRGFWWDEKSNGILFVRVDDSCVPQYRIAYQGRDGVAGDESNYEDHRYPFAGAFNPDIDLGYIPIDRDFILRKRDGGGGSGGGDDNDDDDFESSNEMEISNRLRAESNWSLVKWFRPPSDASEYLARVNWLPDGCACVQWQNRRQSKLMLTKINVETGHSIILHEERSDVWINLHHMFKVLPYAIHPNECLIENKNEVVDTTLPPGSFSFLFASERTGFCHIYLYTYAAGDLSATLLRSVTDGEWIVESIVGVDMKNDVVYVTGTYDSPLEKHLYVLPLRNSKSSKSGSNNNNGGVLGVRRGLKQVINTLSGTSSQSKRRDAYSFEHPPPVMSIPPPDPIRITKEAGMHSIVMDESCRIFVDTSSDLTRPTSSKIFSIGNCQSGDTSLLFVLYDSTLDMRDDSVNSFIPELLSFPTSDGSETLHAALYRPDVAVHGSGPYPLICAVYGGPHVQRVNRSWSQSADMRVQRLCSLGFAVVKCDNRGSSRRGLSFEGAIKNNLGRVEVLDQVAAVRYLVVRRIADPKRVGIYGWSYGGYLAAMCLSRAPDVFHVAIAGAPVTSWDGYDTHYTERYMGMPSENRSGYSEAAVFQHVHNMRGKLMIIHGLIDENVHFRHTARLINRLVSAGKDYDLLVFPDERHSPRRLRDRVYMEKRMSDYFVKNLLGTHSSNNRRDVSMLGHL